MYTAIVLTAESRNLLLQKLAKFIPHDWEKKAHHFTIHMGRLKDSPAKDFDLNSVIDMTIETVAKDGLVMAVGISSVIPSSNKIKHITMAVNRAAGGKPVFSNKLTNWVPMKQAADCDPFTIYGTLKEVE